MSSGLDGGRGGRGGAREVFLSSHRCPEVDLLPHHDSKNQIPPPDSLVPEFTCTGQSEANYLDVSSSGQSEKEEEEEEEEEGSVSDWSDEDLSFHFSPSVILPSDEEESDPESGFECIDVSMETQVKGQEGEGLKMVPKRLIQLKKKKDAEITDQVILKDGPAEGGGANIELSANELPFSTVRHCPDLLLRQHSMPASLHTHSTTSSDVDSYRVYRGLVAGASQGLHVAAPRQRLQKSFSLDETKTKMASCIIKSVLSKKMQVEQNPPQKKPVMLPVMLPVLQQRGREAGGGAKAPVHVVRDVRSLVKNTYSLSFCTAAAATTTTTTTTKPHNNNKSFKVIGQQDSPPPSYQQAVGVKGHDETKRGRGHVAKVAASLSQSQDREQSDSRPITQQRRGSEPIISRRKLDDVTSAPPPPPRPPSSPSHPRGAQPPLPAQEQSPILGVSSQPAPGSSQQILQPCFYAPAALPAFPHSLHPHLGRVSYVHGPLSYIQTPLQHPQSVPTLHLLRRSEENQSAGTMSVHQDHFLRTCLPHWSRTAGDPDGHTVPPATPEQHQQLQQQLQQQLLCGFQGFLPAQVGSDFLIDITSSAAAPGAHRDGPAPVIGPAPCNVMLEPKSGRYIYVDTPPLPQRKMLLDPETGQYVQVFLPAAGSAPNGALFPGRCANPAPVVVNPAPTVLMQFQPTVAMSSLYAPPCLPVTLHTPSVNYTHTAP